MAKQIVIPKPTKVPHNWCWIELGKLTSMKSGFPFDSKRFTRSKSANARPLIRIRDVVNGATETYTDQECPKEYVIKKGEILIGMDGDFNVGKWQSEDALLNQRVCCIQSCSSLYLDDFLFYYLPDPLKKINDATPSVTVKHLSTKTLAITPVPVPPLPEQQRIVNRIESLFAKLDEAKQKAQDALDSFETRKAAILHKAFTGELTAQWRKEHGVGMESWETHELVECFEIVSGIQKTPARSPKDNPIPYLAVANVYRDKIDLSDIRYFEVTPEEIEKLKLQDKDILIVEGNGSGNEIGRCAMWHNELPLCIHQNHIIRMRNKTADVLPEYVLYYLNSQAGRSVMQERAKTTAGLYNLSAGKVKTIPLAFASLDEQIEIVRILDDLLVKEQQAKEAAEGVLDQIDLIKKAILARAFRGELGTNDPSEESAVELLKVIV